MEDILKAIPQALAILGQWKVLGALGVLAALVSLTVTLAKTSLGQAILSKVSLKHKWLRPVLAAALGFLAAACTALASHEPWLQVLSEGLAGLMSGLVGIGGYEFLKALSPRGRQERAAAAAVSHALTGKPEEVAAKVETYVAELHRARALPDKRARMAAVAAWAINNPPGAA